MNPLEILNKYFGHPSFRPGQEEIINAILNDKNVLAILPTGAGKSLCYQIPALANDRFSIVISPLIALMKDQVDALNAKEEIAAYINSSVEYHKILEIYNKIYDEKIKLLYVSPEKLESPGFAERIKNLSPKYIFIDEAHCISEWGHNFRPSYRKITEFCSFIGNTRISAFTATATPEVRDDIVAQLKMKNPELFIRGFERENLHLRVFKTKKKKPEVLKLVQTCGTPAIVYTSTRKNAEELTEYLKTNKINCEFYHAGLAPEKRRLIQDDFINDYVEVIVATNAFGMGIDKKDIRLIIHYNLPGTIESYYQEIGRAGRDGKDSQIHLLFDGQDKYIQEFFIKTSFPGREQIRLIYSLICNYGQVPLGIQPETPIPLDKKFYQILSSNEINKALFSASLGILEEAGYIRQQSELHQNYYLKINLEKERLREYVKNLKNNTFQEILITILREYGGYPFSGKTKINLANLAQITGLTKPDLIFNLDDLTKIGILEFEKPLQSPSVYLTATRVDEKYLNFDYAKIQKQLENSRNKLEAMIGFVNTKKCRFNYILDYFGETLNNYKCGKCDNCGGNLQEDASKNYIQENILISLFDLKSPVNEEKLFNILSGKSSEIGTAVSNFGVLANYSLIEIDEVLTDLVIEGNINCKNSILTISDTGIELIKPKIEKKLRPVKENYEERLVLYNELSQKRKEIALKFGQTASLICSDEILKSIADKKPASPSELMDIDGFNQRKFNKIGDDFLEIIQSYLNQTVQTDTSLPEVYQEIIELINKQYSLEEICEIKKLPEAIISVQIETILSYLPDIEISTLIKPAEIKEIKKKIDEGLYKLKEIKSQISNHISYGKIRIVLAKNKSGN